jgi:hypothetical protein
MGMLLLKNDLMVRRTQKDLSIVPIVSGLTGAEK